MITFSCFLLFAYFVAEKHRFSWLSVTLAAFVLLFFEGVLLHLSERTGFVYPVHWELGYALITCNLIAAARFEHSAVYPVLYLLSSTLLFVLAPSLFLLQIGAFVALTSLHPLSTGQRFKLFLSIGAFSIGAAIAGLILGTFTTSFPPLPSHPPYLSPLMLLSLPLHPLLMQEVTRWTFVTHLASGVGSLLIVVAAVRASLSRHSACFPLLLLAVLLFFSQPVLRYLYTFRSGSEFFACIPAPFFLSCLMIAYQRSFRRAGTIYDTDHPQTEAE